MIIREGQLVAISEGEWDNYRIMLVGRALQEIDTDALKTEWLAAHPDQAENYHASLDGFVLWLLRDKKLFSPVDVMDWRVGAYSNFYGEKYHDGGRLGDFREA